MKLKIAAIAAASLLAFNAQAVSTFSTFGGPHETLERAFESVPFGTFNYLYSFSLLDPVFIFGSAVSNNNKAAAVIDTGTVFLFNALLPAAAIGSFAFDGTTGSTAHQFGPLLSGDYHYQVTVNATGTDGGAFSLTSTLAPVPEPQTYALLLAGLGVIGFVARRRRPQA